MNTMGSWSVEEDADATRQAAFDAARRSSQSLGDWLDEVIAERHPQGPVPGDLPDHRADMKAIAAELARMSGSGAASASRALQEADHTGRTAPSRPDDRAAIRDAVAAIARRQATLDGLGAFPPSTTASRTRQMAGAPRTSDSVMSSSPSRRAPSAGATPASLSDADMPSSDRPSSDWARPDSRGGSANAHRFGADLSSEVSETFARFSRELQSAIQATDARPKVDALDLQMRQIGRAVEDLGAGLAPSETLAQIGDQTREVRDLLKAAAGRSVPLDAVERHVTALEARLGRLAALPAPTNAGTIPDFADTMAEVRALLQGFQPAAVMASLETRLDDITKRIDRGLDEQGPASLIEGLSRRVDEIHASLRSQLAESAVDTRPLEGLVRGLSDRIGHAREATSDFRQLELAMRDVAAKIDNSGPRHPQGLETQLARLAERLDRSETSLKALDGVEQSLGELFSQFEVTRQVAIDAAETAARTAARDTLRAALQSPGLGQRPAELPPAFADQMVRGLDDLRGLYDMAERRTVTTLSDMQATMERLARHLEAGPTEEPRRRRPAAEAAAPDGARVVIDPADLLIEPGSGRGGGGSSRRAEPRPSPEPSREDISSGPVTVDGEGPASFIAAARRAAQAAQVSAASTAAFQEAQPRGPAVRARRSERQPTGGIGLLDRARAFVSQRRRPILLGLAALVLLVGALEVVKLSVAPSDGRTAAVSELASPPSRTRVAEVPPAAAEGEPSASVAPHAPPPARPALPMFVAGPAKAQAQPAAQAPVDGISDGLRSLAAAGDPGAEYEVGLRFADGRGVARDPKQAIAWFDKAAAQGSAPAQYRLGSAYEKGVGTDRDPALAIGWYGKAAEAGNIRAMHNLAVMSAEGAVGKPDYAKAAQWFGKASTFGVRDSQFNLAILYARGLGIEQSLAQSYTWFAVAAAGGDDDAAKKRDEVATKLDAKTLAAAKAAADAFRPTTPIAASNEVPPPPGGWDAATPRQPSPGAKVSQL